MNDLDTYLSLFCQLIPQKRPFHLFSIVNHQNQNCHFLSASRRPRQHITLMFCFNIKALHARNPRVKQVLTEAVFLLRGLESL